MISARRAVFVGVIALAVGLLAAFAVVSQADQDDTFEAIATVGIAEAVPNDQLDAERQRLIDRLGNDRIEEIRSEAGATEVEFIMPVARSHIAVVARAPTGGPAVNAASKVAAEMVALEAERLRAPLDEAVTTIENLRVATEDDYRQQQAAIDASIRREAEIVVPLSGFLTDEDRADLEADLRAVQDEQATLRSERDAVIDDANALLADELRAEVARVTEPEPPFVIAAGRPRDATSGLLQSALVTFALAFAAAAVIGLVLTSPPAETTPAEAAVPAGAGTVGGSAWSEGPPGLVGAALAAGLAIAVWSSSVDLTVVGRDELGPTSDVMWAIQRLSVYLALAIALAARVPVIDVLRRPATALFAGYTGWAIIGSLAAEDPGSELERALWFGAFVLVTLAVLARFGWQRFLVVVAGTALGLVAAGLVAHLADWSTPDRTEFFDGGLFGYERVRGLQPTANGLGRAGAFLALAGAILLLGARTWTGRLLALAAGLAGLAGTLASQSRFSLLGLAIGLAIVTAQRWRWARLPAVLALAAGTAVTLFVLLTGTLGPFSRASDSDELATVLGRTQVWEESLGIVADHPVFGIGTEGMLAFFDRFESGGYAFWDPENGHNVLIHAAAAHGVLAAALVLSALVVGSVYAWRQGEFGSAATITAFAAIGVVEALLIGSPTVAIVALIGALAMSTRTGLAAPSA